MPNLSPSRRRSRLDRLSARSSVRVRVGDVDPAAEGDAELDNAEGVRVSKGMKQ